MKEFAKAFYHSRPWKRVRELVIKRDKGLCQACKRRGEIKPGTIVHHKRPLTPENINDHTISLNPHNLECICKDCHEAEHKRLEYGAFGHASKEKPRIGFDADGNVIELDHV